MVLKHGKNFVVQDVVPKRNRADTVVDYIHGLIRERNLTPGDSLPTERQIAQTLGVSRGPVREGMGRLRALGLVEARTKAGARLTETCPKQLFSEIVPALAQTQAQMVDLVEFREVIEAGAAALASQRRTSKNLAQLVKIVEDGKNLIDNGPDAFYESDKQFHLTILEGSHNKLLVATGSVIREFVMRASDIIDNVTPEQLYTALVDAQTEHEQILRAIQLRNASGAAALMRMHLQQILAQAGIDPVLPPPTTASS
jgi:DNA-binding FadR family transcriptional regulator